jgi:hypothetical protein
VFEVEQFEADQAVALHGFEGAGGVGFGAAGLPGQLSEGLGWVLDDQAEQSAVLAGEAGADFEGSAEMGSGYVIYSQARLEPAP